MVANKNRLYVTLQARGGEPKMAGLEDKYHWSFVTGPKSEAPGSKGRRYHAKESFILEGEPPTPRQVWVYDDPEIRLAPTAMLLVRILVAKIKDSSRLESIFRNTPLRPEVEGWNCVGWVKEAFETALDDSHALGTCAAGWQSVRDTAMWYVETKKAAHRFDEQASSLYDLSRVATWDMLTKKELIE